MVRAANDIRHYKVNISDRIRSVCSNYDAGFLPKAVKLELTTFCNHYCSYCMNTKMRVHADMPDEVFKCALEDIARLKIPEVGLFHIGESTLHSKLAVWHKALKEKSPSTKTFLTTNGTRLEPLLKLMEDGLDSLKFSLNGWDKSSQKALVGVDDFDLVQANVKAAVSARDRNGWKTQISGSALLSSNDKAQQTFKEEMEKLLDDFYMTEVFTQAGNMHPKQATRRSSEPLKTHEFPCYAPFNMLYVLPDGTMSICKYGRPFVMVVGNVLSMHIDEAWTSMKAQAARKLHLSHMLEVCGRCMREVGTT